MGKRAVMNSNLKSYESLVIDEALKELPPCPLSWRIPVGVESWEVIVALDDVLEEIASKAEDRLALQGGEG